MWPVLFQASPLSQPDCRAACQRASQNSSHDETRQIPTRFLTHIYSVKKPSVFWDCAVRMSFPARLRQQTNVYCTGYTKVQCRHIQSGLHESSKHAENSLEDRSDAEKISWLRHPFQDPAAPVRIGS